jgi:hypothetical protein
MRCLTVDRRDAAAVLWGSDFVEAGSISRTCQVKQVSFVKSFVNNHEFWIDLCRNDAFNRMIGLFLDLRPYRINGLSGLNSEPFVDVRGLESQGYRHLIVDLLFDQRST